MNFYKEVCFVSEYLPLVKRNFAIKTKTKKYYWLEYKPQKTVLVVFLKREIFEILDF